MLKTNKNITITGQSMIGDTQPVQVVFMSANISTDGNSNASITTNIMNESVYEANKIECRKDIADFQTAVYATQDEITADAAATPS